MENFEADTEQNQAAGNLGPGAQPRSRAEQTTQPQTQRGESRSDQADDQGREPDTDLKHGKAQTHGQGIDTGGHRKGDEHPSPCRVHPLALLMRLPDRLPDHLDPHEGEEPKSEPVVKGFDIGADRETAKPTEDVHSGLKKTEMEGQPEHLPGVDLAQADPGGQGHGESIHGQGQGDEQDCGKFHGRGCADVFRRGKESGCGGN